MNDKGFPKSWYRVDGHIIGLGVVCFLTRYCFVCHILLGQVRMGQNGQFTLAAMVETTKSQSTKNSLNGDRPPCNALRESEVRHTMHLETTMYENLGFVKLHPAAA